MDSIWSLCAASVCFCALKLYTGFVWRGDKYRLQCCFFLQYQAFPKGKVVTLRRKTRNKTLQWKRQYL